MTSITLENEELPQASVTTSTASGTTGSPSLTSETTTSSATTVTLVQDEVPLADTGEALSWQLFAGIGMILAAGILTWKRQSSKA